MNDAFIFAFCAITNAVQSCIWISWARSKTGSRFEAAGAGVFVALTVLCIVGAVGFFGNGAK